MAIQIAHRYGGNTMSLQDAVMLFLFGISIGISIGIAIALWLTLQLLKDLIARRNKKRKT
jgi:NhaP-type Na+/H+ or K+/H+ antiporter